MRKAMVIVLATMLLPSTAIIASGQSAPSGGPLLACFNRQTGDLRLIVNQGAQCRPSELPISLVGGNPSQVPPLETILPGGGGTGTGEIIEGPGGSPSPPPPSPAFLSGLTIFPPVVVAGNDEVTAVCPPGQIAITGGAKVAEVFGSQSALIESHPHYEASADPILNVAPRGWVGKGSRMQALGTQIFTANVNFIFPTPVTVWAVCATPAP